MMINRGGILLRCKAPALAWIQNKDNRITDFLNDKDLEVFSEEELQDLQVQEYQSLEELNADALIYLIHDNDVDNLQEWITLNFMDLFEAAMLEKDAVCPEDRSLEMFFEWFSVECHGLVIDTVPEAIKYLDLPEGEEDEEDSDNGFQFIDRACVILRYKKPMLDWVNGDTPKDSEEYFTLEDINSDRTLYLVHEKDLEALDEWISLNFTQVFETELEDWSEDEAAWPADRSLAKFSEYFLVESCELIDLDPEPIVRVNEAFADFGESA